MSARSFADFLRTALDALEREAPAAHSLLCGRLFRLRIEARVGSEHVTIHGDRERLRIESGTHAPPDRLFSRVELHTDRDTILGLVDGECTLLDAVLEDRLMMRGASRELQALYDGLLAFVHGGLRAASFPGILDAYRRAGDAREEAA